MSKKKSPYAKLADMAPLWLEHRKLPRKKPEPKIVVSIWADLEQEVKAKGDRSGYVAQTGPSKNGTWTVCTGGRVYWRLNGAGIGVVYVGKSSVLLTVPAEIALGAGMIYVV